MKKKWKDIMVMIPGKMKKHKKLTAALLVLFVLAGVFAGRLALTRKAKGGNQIQTQKATKGTIKKTVEGSGSVASAGGFDQQSGKSDLLSGEHPFTGSGERVKYDQF